MGKFDSGGIVPSLHVNKEIIMFALRPASNFEVALARPDHSRCPIQEAVEGIRRGYAGHQAGRTQSSEEVFEELRVKHGLPR